MATKKSITKTEVPSVSISEILTHTEKEFNAAKPKLFLIKDKDIKIPTIPIKAITQESKDLAEWCAEDKGELVNIGIKEEIIDSLLFRAELLQWTQSNWLNYRFNKAETHRQWLEESEKAYILHKKLLHDFKFAYRNNSEVIRKLKIVRDGSGHADLFQDLSDMAVIGRNNTEELTVMNFDMKLLDEAEEKARRLGTLLAMSRAGETNHGSKDLRNRAYTYLKIAVDEVRAGGQHLFWHNDDRLRGYKSTYNSSHNSSRKSDTSAELDSVIK